MTTGIITLHPALANTLLYKRDILLSNKRQFHSYPMFNIDSSFQFNFNSPVIPVYPF